MEEANIKRAAELKNEGNDFFKDKKYPEAIEKYSDAIVNLLSYRITTPNSASYTQTDRGVTRN